MSDYPEELRQQVIAERTVRNDLIDVYMKIRDCHHFDETTLHLGQMRNTEMNPDVVTIYELTIAIFDAKRLEKLKEIKQCLNQLTL